MRHLLAAAALGLAACGTTTDDPYADVPELAPLAEKSGACPDLSDSGIKTFTSAGVERRAGIYIPRKPREGMGIRFNWHGLSTADFQPMESLISGLDAQGMANEDNVVVVVPEALGVNLGIAEVLLWGILGNDTEGQDLSLFDDLRTCIAETFEQTDLRRVTSWGHSGGGLWTSLLIMDRSDVLASAVSSSGGIEISALTFGEQLPYRTPERDIPVMLIDGGPTDVWPDGFPVPVIEFEKTTDTFEQRLVADGHYVVHCNHDLGHNYQPSWWFDAIMKFQRLHTFGDPSPFETGDKSLPDACDMP